MGQEDCSTCGGSGYVNNPNTPSLMQPCSNCGGTGQIHKCEVEHCPICDDYHCDCEACTK